MEVGIDGRVISITVDVLAFILVAFWFPVSVPNFGGSGVFEVELSQNREVKILPWSELISKGTP